MNGKRSAFRTAIAVLSVLAFLVMTCGSSRADFEAGREAYLRGDYTEAFDQFLPSAMHGNTRSRIGIGLLLARGQGTKADYIGSYSWFDMAADEASGEHVVVRILARTNRDFLKKQMTAEQVAKAKLRSTMILAPPGRRNDLVHLGFHPTRAKRPLNGAPANTDPNAAALYRIQLAALPNGYPTELRSLWSRLAGRHAFLSRLEPVLVRLDLGDAGVYDALRVGSFDDPRNAYVTCDRLIADSQDCFVVAK